MRKENSGQAQILETFDKKEENMKQEINPNNTEEYENIEEKKPAKDVKEQSTNDLHLQEVTITNQNDTNIATAPKEKTRSQITERRLGAIKQGQRIINIKIKKVQEQDGEDKVSCPKSKKYVRKKKNTVAKLKD